MGWVITKDAEGKGEALASDSKSLGPIQTAFDAEVTAIEGALFWYVNNRNTSPALIIHSDSTSAMAKAGHTGAGPGQEHAIRIQRWVKTLSDATRKRTVDLVWVKGHTGTSGNERADELAGKAAERVGTQDTMSLSYIRLRISERFNKAKEEWHAQPAHHGSEEIPPPPPKKSMLNRQELDRSGGRPDKNGPLALGRVPQADPQEGVGPLLALQGDRQNPASDVPRPCAPELPQPPGGRHQGGSVGK
jgi:ribonuclease HI